DQISTVDTTNQQYNIFGSHSSQGWSLRYLESIEINGPPASVICLEHLRLFPALKDITMVNIGYPMELHRNPLVVKIESDDVSLDPDTCEPDTTPLSRSTLKEFRLGGHWEMSDLDIISLLTTYAPYLEEFRTGQLQCYGPNGGYKVLEAVHRADEENKNHRYKMDPQHMRYGYPFQPGNLNSVRCTTLGLTDEEVHRLGLKRIDPVQSMRFHDAGVRVYEIELDDCTLVRSVDAERIPVDQYSSFYHSNFTRHRSRAPEEIPDLLWAFLNS
ncbi:hypothetical protein BGZ76_007507, partial [Entomortierella beljakovae]